MRPRRTRGTLAGVGRWLPIAVVSVLLGVTGSAGAVAPSLPGVFIDVVETVSASASFGPAAGLSSLVDDESDVGEDVTVADSVEVVVVSPPTPEVTEAVSVADLVEVVVVSPPVIEVSESIAVADLVEVVVVSPLVIDVSESIGVGDLVDVQVTPVEEPVCSVEDLSAETLLQLDRLESGEITYEEFLDLIDPADVECVLDNAPECVADGTCDSVADEPDGGCSLEDLSATTLLHLDRLNNGEITYEEFLALADPADLACIEANAPDCVAAGDCGGDEPPPDQKQCEIDGTCPPPPPPDQKQCEIDGTCPPPPPPDQKQCEIDGTCPPPPPPDQKQCEIDGTCPAPTAPPSNPNKGTKP